MHPLRHFPDRSFTLLELMVAVAIIMVLTAVALPQVYDYQVRAKEVEINVNTDGIRTSAFAYEAAFDSQIQEIGVPTDAAPGKSSQAWPLGTNFDDLGWSPDGDVRGVYSLIYEDTARYQFLALGCIDVDVDGVCSRCEAHQEAHGCEREARACCFATGTPITMADEAHAPYKPSPLETPCWATARTGRSAPTPWLRP